MFVPLPPRLVLTPLWQLFVVEECVYVVGRCACFLAHHGYNPFAHRTTLPWVQVKMTPPLNTQQTRKTPSKRVSFAVPAMRLQSGVGIYNVA